MNNVTIFTYTHENCIDIWEPYLDSLDKYATEIPSIVIVNEDYENHGRHKFRVYDDTKNYCDEYVRCLRDNVDTKYFIYMQEDFILYDRVNMEAIQRYVNFLEEGTASFVRLIRCGDVSNVHLKDDLYWITDPSKTHASVNCFSMQPTIWNREHFINLYEAARCERFGEFPAYTQNMNRMGIRGVYSYNNEPMRKNSSHYDSSVFPYIATAIVQRKWNMTEYDVELESIFSRYEIDPYHRGVV